MAGVKFVMIFPRPLDEEGFEKLYLNEHMPMVEDKLKGMTRFVVSRVLRSPQGKVAAYRVAEIHFSSTDDLTRCMESEGGRLVLEHAVRLSTGGVPIQLVCDEQSFVYW